MPLTVLPALVLRPAERRDLTFLLEEFPTSDELRLWTGNYFRHPLDAYQLRAHWRSSRRASGGVLLCGGRKSEGEPMAYGEITRMTVNRSAFLSRIVVRRAWRGRGLGVALVKALASHAFVDLKLHRLELNVCEQNLQAIRCYEKAGFQREGLLREVLAAKDGYWNEYRMSVLRHEYRL